MKHYLKSNEKKRENGWFIFVFFIGLFQLETNYCWLRLQYSSCNTGVVYVDDAWFNHNFSLANKLYVGNCQCSTYAIELGDQAPMKLPLVLCQNKRTWYLCLKQKTSSESKVVVRVSLTTVTRVWFWLHVFDSTHLIILLCIAVSKININFTAPKCYKYWMNIAVVESCQGSSHNCTSC